MIINKGTVATLETAFKRAFQMGFSSIKLEDLYHPRLATVVPSGTKQNYYPFIGQVAKFREWLGDRVVTNLKAHDYTIVNRDFELTIEVDRNDIEDDQYGVYEPLMREMGYAAKMHPDELLFELIAAAASTLCFDGQNFLDTDHPVGDTTASNYDATGGGDMWLLLDTRRPLKPFIVQQRKKHQFQSFTKMTDESVFKTKKFTYGADARLNVGFGLWQCAYGSLNTLNSTNFEAYRKAMRLFVSDEGRPLGIRPNLLVCGPGNQAAAEGLLKAQFLANGATNINFQAVDLLVVDHLDL